MKLYKFLKDLPHRLKAIEKSTTVNSSALDELSQSLSKLESMESAHYGKLNEKLSSFSAQLNNLKHVRRAQAVNSGLQADDHFFDNYYRLFEDRFRGSEAVIQQRLDESYGEFFKKLPKSVKSRSVVDVGSGRGELLIVLKKYGIKSIGVDLNGEMVDLCNANGLHSVQSDAIAYLRNQPAGSLAGVTGIHIAEHLPFELLYTLLSECRRTVCNGGFVLFETPNPENVSVGAHTFWFDSSHIKPLPPLAFSFLAEYVGFSDVSIKRMRPISDEAAIKLENSSEKDVDFIQKSLLGPVDYALIARP